MTETQKAPEASKASAQPVPAAVNPDAAPRDEVAMLSLNADGSSAQTHDAVVITDDPDFRPAGLPADAAAVAAAAVEAAGGAVAE